MRAVCQGIVLVLYGGYTTRASNVATQFVCDWAKQTSNALRSLGRQRRQRRDNKSDDGISRQRCCHFSPVAVRTNAVKVRSIQPSLLKVYTVLEHKKPPTCIPFTCGSQSMKSENKFL